LSQLKNNSTFALVSSEKLTDVVQFFQSLQVCFSVAAAIFLLKKGVY